MSAEASSSWRFAPQRLRQLVVLQPADRRFGGIIGFLGGFLGGRGLQARGAAPQPARRDFAHLRGVVLRRFAAFAAAVALVFFFMGASSLCKP